ncbi:MAG: IPT/TIG domain-containing protein [Candidatus Pseudobacter hemicellulosilyticus]|uniref:IPT/TIG domain-containing protein n=1 Tax=Candidatus Pseudobacter hemicellulosilyticus TaxID=3121375 RepID=A0AAJ5WX06_9BACT|nr:MAG: IPT/TIG domain-containing protein [Pseudobacter sp.]
MKRILYLLVAACFLFFGCRKDDHKAEQPLTVKSFWPNGGSAGTIVTINGTGFGYKAGNFEVLFNGTPATITEARDTVLIILSPEAGTSGLVTLKKGTQQYEIGQYTYQDLSIAGISPANGPAGTNVSIRGKGFASLQGPAAVTINGQGSIVTFSADTLIVASVPVAAGTGQVRIMVNGQEVTGPDFLFQHIAAIKPMTGGAGTKVTISGEGFNTDLDKNSVAFNGKPATVVTATATELVVTAPEEVVTGSVTVTINEQQTVGSTFTVVPKPLISAVAPLSAPAGATVTITGDYYTNHTDEVKVTFNGMVATVTGATTKSITVQVPGNAGEGQLALTVNDQQTAGPLFREQNLGVAELLPNNGMDGDEIVLKGMGFSTDLTGNKVLFNGVAAQVLSATATELTVVVPAGVSTGAITVESGGLTAISPEFGRAGVITLAGGPDKNDFTPYGNAIAVDSKGNVYVGQGTRIKKVTAAGVVSDFVGSTVSGDANGNGADALFGNVTGIAIDQNDIMYVTDGFSMKVKRVTMSAEVSTAATLSFGPQAAASDAEGNIYVGQMYGGVWLLNKVTGAVTKLFNTNYETPSFFGVIDRNNYFWVTQWESQNVQGYINGVKNTSYAGNYQWGFVDGPRQQAVFRSFYGLTVNRQGVIYLMDGPALRSIANDMVTTITGTNGTGLPVLGYMDGGFKKALFGNPGGMVTDKEGNLYINDASNKAVRKVFFR